MLRTRAAIFKTEARSVRGLTSPKLKGVRALDAARAISLVYTPADGDTTLALATARARCELAMS
jgi:hypothetical protein